MKCAVDALIQHQGPSYLRLGRAPVETVTDSIPGYRFELGKGVTMREGTDVTLVATVLCVQLSLEAAALLESQGERLIWDVEELVYHVREGIDAALASFPKIESFSIDIWGVDYVLFRGEKEVWPCYSY